MTNQRNCKILSNQPQGTDPNTQKPIYWCGCGKFTTNDYKKLQNHVRNFNLGLETKDIWATLFLILTISYSLSILSSKFNSNSFGAIIEVVSSGLTYITLTLMTIPLYYYLYFLYYSYWKTIPTITFPKGRCEGREIHEKSIEDFWATLSEKEKNYDPEKSDAVLNFKKISSNSECLFAKKAKVWGPPKYQHSLSIEQNVDCSLKKLSECFKKGREEKIDAFVFEVPKGIENGSSLKKFGEIVRRVISEVSRHDPNCDHPMEKTDSIDKKGWIYSFDQTSIFLTCFGPCYPENHARYGFGSTSSFILFQPLYSFSTHDIGEDHPWDDTKTTIRQKIRQNFKNANRLYFVPPTRFYPYAPYIVPPLKIDEPTWKWFLKDE